MSAAAKQRQSVAVLGLGSIGGVVAGCLAAAGRQDVVACTRRPIATLTLERPQAGAMTAIDVPLRALGDPAQAKPADWVLLCTKAYQTASARPWLERLCTPATRVAVMQNGIDQVASVAPFANGATVLPIIVYFNGERLGYDRVRLRQGSDQDIAVADDASGHAFANLLAGTPLRVALAGNFPALLWHKLLINAVANPITTLTMQRQAVLRRPDVQQLCHGILTEAIAVARADGVALADDEAASAMATLFSFSGELGTSMYFDRLAGRPLEIEALNGAIVTRGERHGVATPINAALVTLLRAISDAAPAPSSVSPHIDPAPSRRPS